MLPLFLIVVQQKSTQKLFRLKREKEDIRTAFLDNWLYYVLETPFWREKIIKHNGLINNEDKVVYFNEDTDDFDNFWDLYNYEPDEQKKIVQDKSIRPLLNIRTWKIFYNENKGSGLVHIDDEFLDEFEIHIQIHFQKKWSKKILIFI